MHTPVCIFAQVRDIMLAILLFASTHFLTLVLVGTFGLSENGVKQMWCGRSG